MLFLDLDCPIWNYCNYESYREGKRGSKIYGLSILLLRLLSHLRVEIILHEIIINDESFLFA